MEQGAPGKTQCFTCVPAQGGPAALDTHLWDAWGRSSSPVTAIQFLLQNFGPSNSLLQCSSLQTKASFRTGLYLINTCGYKACISDQDWLEVFCFWIRKFKIFPCIRRTPRRKMCTNNTFLAKIYKLLLVEIVLTESGIRPIMSEVHVLCIFPEISLT